MKIITEETEVENAVKNGEMCIAVPFEITVYPNGDTEVRCFSELTEAAEKFKKSFKNRELTEEAFDFMRDKLTDVMDNYGYEADSGVSGHLLYYFADGTYVTKLKGKVGETVMLTKTHELENYELPDFMFSELDDEDELDVCFAAVVDGKIVSYAAVNDLSENGSYEINVETEKQYRNMGLGGAVASELVSYIVLKGERAAYCCEKSNSASISLAKKLGLKLEKESRSFVYYLKD